MPPYTCMYYQQRGSTRPIPPPVKRVRVNPLHWLIWLCMLLLLVLIFSPAVVFQWKQSHDK